MLAENREKILEERLRGIEDISRALSSTLDLDSLLPSFMEKISRIMHADRSTLFILDREQGELWSKIVQGEKHLTICLALGDGIAGEVAVSGKSLNTPDAYAHPNFCSEFDRQTGYRSRSLLSVPLFSKRGEVIGVLQALNRLDGKPFDDKDLSLLEALASHIAIAIEVARLHASVVRHNRELDALYEIEREISCSQDPDQVVEKVLEKVISIIGSEAGSILLLQDNNKGQLYFRTALGERADKLKGYTIEARRGIVGWVAQRGLTARVNDASSDKRYDPTLAYMIGFPARQILAAPLEADDSVIGAVELVNCAGNDSFTVENERLLRLMGTQIARAVTDARKMLERKQRERLAAVGRMLSGLLHDLKTPMTVISGCAEFLVDQESREKRLELAERILRQLSDLEKMTADVMAFVRGESNVLIRRVYLHLFLDELSEILEREAGRSPVEIRWHREYEGAASFDAGSIRRALLNISRNALQAMADGGRLDISTAREGNLLLFRVSDNGPGIPEEIRDTLFDPFVTSGKENGTGLGLAIVRQAVQDHKGTIDVQTEANRGTTFTITIPLDAGKRDDPGKEQKVAKGA